MTIAIVTNTSWNIYNFRLPVIDILKKNGIRVVAIAPEDEFSPYLRDICDDFIPIPVEARGSNPVKDLALIWKLNRIYKKLKPDCILQYTIKPNIYGTLAASMLKIPCINTVSGLGTVFLTENITAKIARFLYRVSFRHASRVLFQNNDDLNLFLKKGLVKKEIAGLVPGSGIDLNKYIPEPYKKNETFTFVLVARLLKDKGIREYAEACRSLKNKGIPSKCLLAGTPGDIPLTEVENWTREGIISYIGFSDNVRELISSSHCVVLPSYREGLPRTLLEGAAMGKPLLATDVPGCRDLVRDNENGFLCREKDAQDLAMKMEKLLIMEEKALAEFGRRSRDLVEPYDSNIVAEKYLSIIKETMNKNTKNVLY